MDWRIDDTTKTADGPNPKGRPRTVTSTILKSMYCQIKAPVGKPPKGGDQEHGPKLNSHY